MKNELQKLTEDISRLFEETYQKTESLGQIGTITRLYDELQNHLDAISAEEVELLQKQLKSTMEQMVSISRSLNMIKALKLMLDGQDGAVDSSKNHPPPQSPHLSEEHH